MAPKTREVGIRLTVKDKEIVERALRDVGQEGSAAFKKIMGSAEPAAVSIRALNAAVHSTNTNLGKLSGTQFFTNFTRGAVGALVPAIGLGVALQGARDALDQFGQIADDAKASGVTTGFLQETAHAAELAGVSYEEFSASLVAFNKNAGLAASGKGRMVTQLKVLNPELLNTILLATTQEERVRLAADAIDKEADASKKAALATVLFGDAGARMVEVFAGGRDALNATAQSAREMGIVIDSDLIQRAEELGDQFDVANKILDLEFKRILIELAPFIIGTAQAITGMVRAVRDLWKAIGEAPGMQSLAASTAPLSERDIEIMQRQLATKTAFIDEQQRQHDEALEKGGDLGGFLWSSGGFEEGMAKLRKERDALAAAIAVRSDPSQFDVNGTFDLLDRTSTPDIFAPKTDGGAAGVGGGRNAEADRAIREAEQLIRRVRTAGEEYADTLTKLDEMQSAGLISQTDYGRAVAEASIKLANAAKFAGDYEAAQRALDQSLQAGLITEQDYTETLEAMTRRRLEASNSWIDGVKLGLLEVASSSDSMASKIGDSIAGAFDDATNALAEFVQTGKLDFADLVDSITQDLIKLSIQQGIMGPLSGALGSILGGIFGGGAGGGYYPGLTGPSLLAKGGVFSGPGIGAHSNSVVTQPTMFAFAKGAGLMGEAGPEAILPLIRDSLGRLGVRSSGGDASSAPVSAELTVINNAPGVNVRRGEDRDKRNGGRRPDYVIEEAVGNAIARPRGPAQRAIAASGALTRR